VPNLAPLTLSADGGEVETAVLVLQADALNPGGLMPPQKGDPMDPKELAALQDKLAKLEAQNADLTAKLSAANSTAAEAAVQVRLDSLVKDGKLTPAQAAQAKPVLLATPAEGVVTLSEGKTGTPRDAMFALLESGVGHGLLQDGKVPGQRPAELSEEKAFDAAVQKHLDAGKPYAQAVELAARDCDAH
jgi:hypothetical protein